MRRPTIDSPEDLAKFWDTHIVARATDEQALAKLRQAGANVVFTPYSCAGHRLAQALLRPHVKMQFNPSAHTLVEPGDVLIAIGESSKLRDLEKQVAGERP